MTVHKLKERTGNTVAAGKKMNHVYAKCGAMQAANPHAKLDEGFDAWGDRVDCPKCLELMGER